MRAVVPSLSVGLRISGSTAATGEETGVSNAYNDHVRVRRALGGYELTYLGPKLESCGGVILELVPYEQ